MECRISGWLLTIPLALLCGGCITSQPQKNVSTNVTPINNTTGGGVPSVPNVPVVHTPPVDTSKVTIKKDDGPKRNPRPETEVAFGKLKEAEADSDNLKANPGAQAIYRDQARIAYQAALKIDPNHLEAQRRLGLLYAKMGDYERSQEVFKKAMVKHSKEPSLWYDLGQCHNRRKDFNESVRCFAKALELDPENRDYLKKLGYTLAWAGNVEQGLAYLIRAYGVPLAHYQIACMYDQKKNTDLAIRHLRLARRDDGQLMDEARELLEAIQAPTANRVQRVGG